MVAHVESWETPLAVVQGLKDNGVSPPGALALRLDCVALFA